MKKVYPRISNTSKRDRNSVAKCQCGKVAKFMTFIQFNYMRGDDEGVWSCADHKNDLDLLIGGIDG